MKVLTLIFSTFLFVSVAWAQVDTSQFNIRIFGGEDLEAPTTPTLLSVTPIASTQIDVVWSASIDNFAVAGYVLYRDNNPFATTTQTNFSDTGLSPSTTYQYYVQTFDAAGNYSATSSTLSTTTPDTPPPPPDPVVASSTSNGGTATRVVLDELVISSGFSTTSFAIKTARPARFEVRWGRTGSYELGYIATERFLRDYQTTLTDLEPGTVYEYEVIGYSPQGIPSILERGQFTTLGNEALFAPENVVRFSAVAQNTDVALNWQLPTFAGFSYVRIVRSHLGYPTHVQDGAVIYQGSGTTFLDRNILEQYSPVYYTAFVVDQSGRVSSGAIAQVFAFESTGDGGEGSGGGLIGVPPPVIEVPEAERLLPEFRMPDPSEIFITQGSRTDSFGSEGLSLKSEELFLVSIPKSAIAQNLKTIIATLTDPTDNRKSYSFLLRINNDDTAYEATVAPLMLSGTSGLTITIYDYEARVVGTRSQIIDFYTSRSSEQMVFWPDFFIAYQIPLLSLTLLFLLLFLLFVSYRKTLT